jgi:putative ABC transport system ATP-binding protein
VRVDIEVGNGELVLLHGPSGCGKTTLLSAIAGLLRPDEGSILVEGHDVASLTGGAMLAHRRSRVGVVFQSFNLIDSLTALENVALPLTMSGVRRGAARSAAAELLGEVGLSDRLQHRPGALSGGQQQRVAIARALVVDPPVLLADEPTAHLDHVQVEVVRGMLRRIADSGRMVIVSTHDDRLLTAADRVVDLRPSGPSLVDPVAPDESILALTGGR